MNFINANGDTLQLGNAAATNYITIANDTFRYFNNGFIQLLTHFAGVNLYRKKVIKFNGREKQGAYGTYNTTSAATSVNNYSDQNGNINQDLRIDENTVYAVAVNYYLSRDNQDFVLAAKKNLNKLFPGKEKIVAEYLKTNKINFNKEADLVALIVFMNGG
jgi:hypothetical protein